MNLVIKSVNKDNLLQNHIACLHNNILFNKEKAKEKG